MLMQVQDERQSGYPQPQLYDQYFINKYAYPKGLKCGRRGDESPRTKKKSLYDMSAPQNRKGFSGWKLTLTKKPEALEFDDDMFNSQIHSVKNSSYQNMSRQPRKNGGYHNS